MTVRMLIVFLFLSVFSYGFEILAPIKNSIHNEEFATVSVKLNSKEIEIPRDKIRKAVFYVWNGSNKRCLL